MPKFKDPSRTGDITELEVATHFLKQGYEEKVRRVEWVVLDWNTPARDFYINSGAKILHGWETVQMDSEGIHNFVKHKKK